MHPPRLSPPPLLHVLATAAGTVVAATLLIVAPPASAQGDCAAVEIHNVRPQQGHLMVAVYGSAETYRKKALTQMRVAAGDATMRFNVCGLAGQGEVALVLFQDLDSDGRMGANVLGLPTEPWGSSGSPGAFGPSWDSGRVKLDGMPVVVKMSS